MFIRKSLILLLFALFLGACTDDAQQSPKKADLALTQKKIEAKTFTETSWDDLMPKEYSGDAIVAKYKEQLDKFEDSDSMSPEADALYKKITKEMSNAPVNEAINHKHIKLPGFIAPLTQHNGVITEFLLVPYFGACIHTPPPPINQTVLVKTAPNHGIKTEDSFGAIWVSGKMEIENKKTDIGEAGYRIKNAVIEPYTE